MIPVKPYLVRALVDWIVDSDETPYLVIDCTVDGVDAPADRSKDGKLVLNISATATRNLNLGNDLVDVDCRFGGAPVHIQAPIGAIVAVYSRETGMGMAFEAGEREGTAESANAQDTPSGARKGAPKRRPGAPKLTLVT